ncbi:M48 family metallopeptidase [Anaerospora sp.]|uniref:M48 family metallopeptidase n=1 Tax=Anaerospora sp. TaxID=1960278 RepID=UPI0028988CA2|nr:M48 family metallopeptidase [Anaerospora sp.]
MTTWSERTMMLHKFRRLLAIILCITFMTSAFALPVAQAYSVNDEIEIGKKVGKALENEYKLVEDAAVQERVERLGRALAAFSDRPDLPYTFKVLNVNEVNALALPGGPVYVFKGLVDFMNDDELAGVIGHEIGHIVKRHSIKQMEKNMGMTLLMLILLGDRGLPLQSVLQQALMARNSREAEEEADHHGYTLTLKAGFNPYSMLMGMQRLAEVSGGSDFGMFASHPEPEVRIKRLKGYIQKSNIHPQVVTDGQSVRLVDGEWTFDSFAALSGERKSESYAYKLAGALYRVAQNPQVRPDWFVLDRDGDNVRVYYDDIIVLTVTAQQAAIAGTTATELAASFIPQLQDWAMHQSRIKNKEGAQAKEAVN